MLQDDEEASLLKGGLYPLSQENLLNKKVKAYYASVMSH